jgi:hypothetical protein
MNYYIKIANQYFHEIEGWHLYPGRREWRFWVIVFTCFLMFIMNFVWITPIDQNQVFTWQWLMLIILSLIWGSIFLRIQKFRQKKFIEKTNESFNQVFQTVNECCIYLLKKKLNVQESDFLDVAKEINEMIELERQYRLAADLNVQFFSRKIYDPESKQRVLAGLLALLTLITALLVRSMPPEFGFSLLLNQSAWSFILLLLLTSAIVFFFIIGLHVFWLVLYDSLSNTVLKFLGQKSKGKIALDYLVRHLVRYHTPLITKNITNKRRGRPRIFKNSGLTRR